MKYLALAVLLAVMQASPPVPRKAADPGNGTPQNVAKQPSSDKTPAKQSPPLIQPISSEPDQNASRNPATENAPKAVSIRELPPVSVMKDWLDKIYIGFTGILIIIGFFGVRAAYRTLRAIEQQVGEMKAQRETMQGQLTTMQGQLAQMKSAGEQTDKLIGQAKNQTEKTGIAAEAAQKSADAFVMSERAYIQVVISKPLSMWTEPSKPGKNRAWVSPDIVNIGRTPAKITKVVFVPYLVHERLGPREQMPPAPPPEPVYSGIGSVGFERDAILAQNTGITPLIVEIPAADCIEVMSRNATLYVYGYVNYFDVLENPHQTRFCQLYWPKSSTDDPHPGGFMMAGNTPATYTEST